MSQVWSSLAEGEAIEELDVSEAEQDPGLKTLWHLSDTARNSLHHLTAPGPDKRDRAEDEQPVINTLTWEAMK